MFRFFLLGGLILIILIFLFSIFSEVSKDLDIVFAIDTSEAVDDNLLGHVKRYVSALFDYFTLPDVPSGSKLSQKGRVRAGVVSFGSVPEIKLTLSEGFSLKGYRYVVNSLRRINNGGGKSDVIGMLNAVQQKLFVPTEQSNKKLLVVFMSPASRKQLDDTEVVKKIAEMKEIYGIQTAFVLIDDRGLDFSRLKEAIGGNFLVVARNGQSLPSVYPDFERLVANTMGKYFF